MAKAWKEFEELVARIERVAAPAGAIVKSNDWLLDHVTGRKRQVDASIRHKVGTAPGLITLETRKRKKLQDATWIEQLATKRINLRADRTIAVSATPVSPQAVKMAAQYMIEVRQLSEIGEDDIRRWLNVGNVVHSSIVANIRSNQPVLFPAGNEPPHLVGAEDFPPGADPRKDPLFICLPTGQKFNELTLFSNLLPFLQKSLAKLKKRPTKDRPVETECSLRFQRGLFGYVTKNGQRDLAAIRFKVQVCLEEVAVAPVNKLYQYSSPDGPLISVAESHAEFMGNKVVVAFHKKEGSTSFETSVHIDTKKPPAKKARKRKQRKGSP